MFYIPKVKICGITNIDDARNALRLGADTLGIVFYEKSKRCVSLETAKSIIKELRKTNREKLKNFLSVKRNVIITGVFVNEDQEKIKSVIKDLDIDIIQLSGNESLDYIENMGIDKNLILKAVHIKEKVDIEKVYAYKGVGLNVLVDTFVGHGIFGGTGVPLDLNIMNSLDAKDLIMAGGIGNDNIGYIVRTFMPYGVDISSKIEDSPGKKNYDKMALFFEELRRASYETAR